MVVAFQAIDYSREDNRRQLYEFLDLLGADTLAPGTRSNYDRHRSNYEYICQNLQYQAWPPSFECLRAYLGHHIYTGHSVNSFPQMISALRHYHYRHPLYHDQPFLSQYDACRLKDFTRSVRRHFPTQVKRKRPLTLDILGQILLISDTSSPQTQMFLTMAFICHNALLRFSELLKLTLSDVFFDHRAGVVRLRLVNTKAAPGMVQMVTLCPLGEVSGASLLAAYWAGKQLHLRPGTNRLFQLDTPVSDRRFKDLFVDRWLRRQLSRLGLVGGEFSGHSFRSGGATDMFRQRLPAQLIKQAGRWRSDVYMLYCRDHPDTAAEIVQTAFDRIIGEAFGFRPAEAG